METDIKDLRSTVYRISICLPVGDLKTALMVGGLTFIISAVVNLAFALLIGYKFCHCVGKYI
jgi:hypothetical protein